MRRNLKLKLLELVTIQVLFKYTDSKHRLNCRKLNEYLKPYDLKCGDKSVKNTVDAMREIGIDVRRMGQFDRYGIWIENRPLSELELNRLIFAVSTNPYLTKEQADEILRGLMPLVTVYQEDSLEGTVEAESDLQTDDRLYEAYSVIAEAIRNKRRLEYKVKYIYYHKDTQSISEKEAWGTLFTPKCIYQRAGEIYMVGYNNVDKYVEAINLKDITDIKIAAQREYKHSEAVERLLADIDPRDYLPGGKERILYKGEVTFVCRGPYIGLLYKKFGPPTGSVLKDARRRTTYTVAEAEITPTVLHWIAEFEDRSIRLKGPAELVERVREYYAECAEAVTDPRIPHTRGRLKHQKIDSDVQCYVRRHSQKLC